jgi:hypothetical protein
MIRRRKIEVHIERHELSIFTDIAGYTSSQSPFSSSPASNPTPAVTWPRKPGRIGCDAEESDLPAPQLSAPRHSGKLFCSICGAHEMLPLTEAIAIARLTATALKEGLETGRYHLHCSLAGEWLICIQSMQQDMQE